MPSSSGTTAAPATGLPPQLRIETVQTNREVEALVRSLKPFDSQFAVDDSLTWARRACGNRPYGATQPAWVKQDFNQDGKLDLLVFGRWHRPVTLGLINAGQAPPQITFLTRTSTARCSETRLVMLGRQPVLLHREQQPDTTGERSQNSWLPPDTLVYRFGAFVNYNPAPRDYRITRLHYETTGCFGTCPAYQLALDVTSRKADFTGLRFTRREGQAQATLPPKTINDITQLLNYANFPALRDSYDVPWTDDQTATLTITYANGSVKRIRDYGLQGTPELSRVYKMLEEIRVSEGW
ncbi:DUF6438 domain-containing protein [Hymenobacter weizhouensis]|uniref:DUF6438 domain-containing protein n=1 Tax=Hymenobacter sp. YIM 151500-1 TaxID=2987689 RepID=UPI00222659E4|nr:DUF6438 domain-containing protein [Hymenobacter sp. YIM 151500-1]UYZ64718.1 DUF6438 domain-containing protein [Hymenobacter sp. YIM 151500-1]